MRIGVRISATRAIRAVEVWAGLGGAGAHGFLHRVDVRAFLATHPVIRIERYKMLLLNAKHCCLLTHSLIMKLLLQVIRS